MSKHKSVLGKGLGALISPLPRQEAEERVSVVPTPETIDDGVADDIMAHIEVALIAANPYQPRLEFEPQALRELAQSIRENGLVQPITVRRTGTSYQLISGERRVRACREAGITHIPAYIRKINSEEEMIELALIENIQRKTLSPMEVAMSYQKLVDEFSYTHDELARKLGLSRSSVVNFIRLLKLPLRVQESLQKEEISMGHARALINVPDENALIRIWQKIVREDLSVRKVEELVRAFGNRPAPPPKKKKSSELSPELDNLGRRLQSTFGTKVHISATKAGKGSITIEFYSHEDFERLYELLTR